MLAPVATRPFRLDTTYASGAKYQPLVRELEAAGRAGLDRILTEQEKNALLQNIRDILTHSYVEAVRGCPHGVIALQRQAQLGRWRYLDQLPADAQVTFQTALAKFNITIQSGPAGTATSWISSIPCQESA